MKKTLFIALGANLSSPVGGPKNTLEAALRYLEKHEVTIRAISEYYHTPAFPKGNGPDFVNAVAEVRAEWTPKQALACLHSVEVEMGRTRGARWAQRTIDLDLIAIDDVVLPDHDTHKRWRDMPLDSQLSETPEQLILPHPRLQDRAFVLIPMADIAAEWVHPILGLTVTQMCEALPDELKAEVRAIPATK